MRAKNLVLTTSLILGLSNPAFAECDFSTGIQKTESGYLYSTDCHKKVGKMVQDLKDREEQVTQLNKTIELKDLMVITQEKRADLWMNTSFKLEDRVNTIERYRDTNKWVYFGLGIATMALGVWGAGQLR